MEELRGRNIQVVLHIKEGKDFNYLKSPIIVTASLNGYTLETDPSVPGHLLQFDAELIWETEKKKFRNLRMQNVPVKIEVYTMATAGHKQKAGYMLLSLLGAQPCPSHKTYQIKYSWHRLLGLTSEGKCNNPQLNLSLTIQDRNSIPTPRNSLSLPSAEPTVRIPHVVHSQFSNMDEYVNEMSRFTASEDVKPVLEPNDAVILIGPKQQNDSLFIITLIITNADNIDLIPMEIDSDTNTECHIKFSLLTHNIKTDGHPLVWNGVKQSRIRFNHKTIVRVRTSLVHLSKYCSEVPYIVLSLYTGEKRIAVGSVDIRKLIPTLDLEEFINTFCNCENTLLVSERCFLLGSSQARPYLDVDMSLQYCGVYQKCKPSTDTEPMNTMRSTNSDLLPIKPLKDIISNCSLKRDKKPETPPMQLPPIVGSDISIVVRELYQCLSVARDCRVSSRDALISVGSLTEPNRVDKSVQANICQTYNPVRDVKDQMSQCDEEVHKEKEDMQNILLENEKELLIRKFEQDLDEWKREQQDLFKMQLRLKEESHLDLLSNEWETRRKNLEDKLQNGVEQCTTLAETLAKATEEFSRRSSTNLQREKKLIHARETLEKHYTEKYEELNLVSKKLEQSFQSELQRRDHCIGQISIRLKSLQRENVLLREKLCNLNGQLEVKNDGVTGEEATELIQNMHNLQNQLENANKSSAFYKSQWEAAVKELHTHRLLQNSKIRRNNSFTLNLKSPGRQVDVPIVSPGSRSPRTKKSQELPHSARSENGRKASGKISSNSSAVINALIDHRDGLLESGDDLPAVNRINERIRQIIVRSEH